MTEHYVTLFDSNFLPQGLALHASLLEHGGDFLLWVLCVNANCLAKLKELDLPHMRLLDLAKLETPELRAVKPSRSRAEYCWTLTPWSIQWVFEADQTSQRVTYLDADVLFLKPPYPIFEEFLVSRRAVMITEHSYAPEYDMTLTAGRFCVQFMCFSRDTGFPVLNWWRDRCTEWCFAYLDNGLFGDQKYLEHFETLFPSLIYSTGYDKRFLAPWNSSIFPYSEAIMFHFHGLRIVNSSLIHAANHVIPSPTLLNVYVPYCNTLLQFIKIYNLSSFSSGDNHHLIILWMFRCFKQIQRILLGLNRPPYWFQTCRGSGFSIIW